MSWRHAVFLVSVLTAGCGPTDRELAYYEAEAESDPEPVSLRSATIDADRVVEGEVPGEHLAAIVEYETGGIWFVGVSCDTNTSGVGCEWDIIVRTLDGEPVFRVLETDLERSDLVLTDVAAARLLAFTTDDFDGFSFRVGDASGLSVDVFLDGRARPELLRWVGDGARHVGAPDNPFELVPDRP